MKSTWEKFTEIASGRAALERAKEDWELSERALKYAFALFDKTGGALTGLLAPIRGFEPIWENKGRERGAGQVVDFEAVKFDITPDGEIFKLYPDELDDLIEWILKHAEREAEKIANPPPAPRSPSKDALRKRKARAEKRVKPRPKRPPRTLADDIAATKKSIETRRAKLAKLEELATQGGVNLGDVRALHRDIAKTREGLRRAESTLRTYEGRSKEGAV